VPLNACFFTAMKAKIVVPAHFERIQVKIISVFEQFSDFSNE
jgi:hypothetical protein